VICLVLILFALRPLNSKGLSVIKSELRNEKSNNGFSIQNKRIKMRANTFQYIVHEINHTLNCGLSTLAKQATKGQNVPLANLTVKCNSKY